MLINASNYLINRAILDFENPSQSFREETPAFKNVHFKEELSPVKVNNMKKKKKSKLCSILWRRRKLNEENHLWYWKRANGADCQNNIAFNVSYRRLFR